MQIRQAKQEDEQEEEKKNQQGQEDEKKYDGGGSDGHVLQDLHLKAHHNRACLTQMCRDLWKEEKEIKYNNAF